MQANEYVEFWNDTLADKFERFRNILMNGLSYHSAATLDQLDLKPGARVLDVGCGWGDTAIQLARKTGPTGCVLGIDCVERFLQQVRQDATEAGINNVQFIATDVEVYPFEGQFDLCFSRFGMMFFNNPVAAMRNIRNALKPGARLVFIVWRRIEDNPWLGLPKEIVSHYLPPPGEDARSCGPGPFSMADPKVVTRQLEIAGFTGIRFECTDGPVTVGDSVEQGMQFQLALGPAGEVFREAGDLAEHRRDEIEQALRSALAPFEKNGKIVMPSSSWTVTAQHPGN
ncbi:MAG TPA: methyltransferase domain-containing protein [Gammaproteobacteria bacterium]